jgi:excisionase family DNA binding protein
MNARWLTTQDAAQYLGITPAALRKRVERGEIPCSKLGRRLWFNVADLDALMAEHRVEAWA